MVTVLANKVRTDDEEAAVREYCERHELQFSGAIRWSDDVIDADSAGRPVLEAAPDSTLVHGVRRLITDLDIPFSSDTNEMVS